MSAILLRESDFRLLNAHRKSGAASGLFGLTTTASGLEAFPALRSTYRHTDWVEGMAPSELGEAAGRGVVIEIEGDKKVAGTCISV